MTEEEKKAQQKLIYIAAQEKCLKQGLGSDPIGFSTCLAKEIQTANEAAKTNKINDWFKSTGGIINKEIESQGGILNSLDKFSDIVNKLRGAQYSTAGGGTGFEGLNLDLSRTCDDGEEFNASTGMCEKKKSKMWIWIVVAVVVILLIVGIVLIVRAKGKKK